MTYGAYPPLLSRQNTGSLVVELATNRLIGPQSPIPNVLVTIKEISPNGDEKIFAELMTNEVGQTEPLELITPPLDYSLDPFNTNQPYSTYRIETKSPEYVDAIIEGTQVFPDTRSIQPITLESTRHLARQFFQEIIIGPATLFGNFPPKIPELEIKPILPGTGFITLDSVIVPEFVIVHAGLPTDNTAPNYTVPFTEYIANVASSEIYPTWPEETIRANVIAITSFTLNRVFTEWYRNQGKNFTITNSTAFDHAFFFGRNIFDTIIPIVADVFTTYVKRPGVTQPLLTQYCDGVQSQCPNWMTQWGSKDLGDAGYTAEQILRNFYGDIELPTAPKVEGIPESYPGSPLQLGSSGSNVRKIQEQLNRISQNYPLIPKVATNGEFDQATLEAVKTFQKIFHLPQDGIVGRNTWYKISQIYVAVTKIGELL
ncbi:peptidoglycan-binding protein [Sporanaerobium hydrogeniformans]|uniref:Peptidoglycan-binding protein n=1 Tax=Sporanaerobium hydrogeniformans TaxID=3072179 RepID=A0AC61DIF8_9FIRM|nr:peptidoglycan-binding protein [Sporanaerobium hydrogeniformans]PHV72321.1 peptidoglycan-binding protein [Sporanaerobium hydrogeniformans]